MAGIIGGAASCTVEAIAPAIPGQTSQNVPHLVGLPSALVFVFVLVDADTPSHPLSLSLSACRDAHCLLALPSALAALPALPALSALLRLQRRHLSGDATLRLHDLPSLGGLSSAARSPQPATPIYQRPPIPSVTSRRTPAQLDVCCSSPLVCPHLCCLST
jgi:hypothetical protein